MMQVLLEGVMNGFAIAYDLLVPDKSKVSNHTHHIPIMSRVKSIISAHYYGPHRCTWEIDAPWTFV